MSAEGGSERTALQQGLVGHHRKMCLMCPEQQGQCGRAHLTALCGWECGLCPRTISDSQCRARTRSGSEGAALDSAPAAFPAVTINTPAGDPPAGAPGCGGLAPALLAVPPSGAEPGGQGGPGPGGLAEAWPRALAARNRPWVRVHRCCPGEAGSLCCPRGGCPRASGSRTRHTGRRCAGRDCGVTAFVPLLSAALGFLFFPNRQVWGRRRGPLLYPERQGLYPRPHPSLP